MQKLLEDLGKVPAKRDSAKRFPEGAGIYTFFKGTKPIYIGKAINLKRRVLSYFDLDLEPKTKRMVSEADHLSFILVTNELEALLLEARLIRKYMPQYNIAAKDDKHPLYIIITKEKYPRVITGRKIDLNKEATLAVYGPFPSSTNVHFVLKHLRRIFPYSDHKVGKRGCLYSHIGLCNPCPSEIERIKSEELRIKKRKEYMLNIKKIKSILDGKIGVVKNDLEKDMVVASKNEDYEVAAKIRDQIKRIEYITQPQIPTESYMENPNLYEDIRKKELSDLRKILNSKFLILNSLGRIECFDIAHLAGSNPTASMVTFINGEADKKFYRHFRIRQNKGNSDADSMREVINRRLKHLRDWGKPDLIIVDGGKSQVGIFVRELEGSEIPVVGLAKRYETLVFPVTSDHTTLFKEYRLPKGPALNLVQRIRDEAHRFARKYHHTLISRELTAQNANNN